MQQSYEVIRFVGQNGKFHIVMDCVEGELLSTYLQREESMSKTVFLRLMANIAKELESLEQSGATEYFPYLTPYHIVLKEDQRIAFLKHNERYNTKIEKIINQFMAVDGTFNYYYSYGRVMQFILTNIRLRPDLSKLEEYRIKKIVSKCMEIKVKKQFQEVRELVVYIKKVKKIRRTRKKRIY